MQVTMRMIIWKRPVSILAMLALVLAPMNVFAYPSGSINPKQLSEPEEMALIKTILQEHVIYAETQFNAGGYFGNGTAGERGVRTNSNYALMYAFLYHTFPDATFSGLPRATVLSRVKAALNYACDTHYKIGNKNSTSGDRWGLAGIWQTAMYTGYFSLAAYLVWNDLDAATQARVKSLVEYEADASVALRIVEANVNETSAETNAWNVPHLAMATQIVSPTHPNVAAWTTRMHELAMNVFSVQADMQDQAILEGKAIKDWIKGPNIYPDYTMVNHSIFHPYYVGCSVADLGTAALIFKMAGKAIPGTFKHNVLKVNEEVIRNLMLPDAEVANFDGNDWAIHDYQMSDMLTTLATVFQDPGAAFLESRLLQYARARQLTTPDRSFMPHAPIGEEYHGVMAQRWVIAYLMHQNFPAPAPSVDWSSFLTQNGATKYYPSLRMVRSLNADRLVSFSWHAPIMANILPNSSAYLDNPYIAFPFKISKNGPGNLTGYFSVTGKANTAAYVASTVNQVPGGFITVGNIKTNDTSLVQTLFVASTPGNAVIYMDEVKAVAAVTVTKEAGTVVGIEVDSISVSKKTITYEGGSTQSDGTTLFKVPGNWANIDGKFAMVVPAGQQIAFGDRALSNTINIAQLYGNYSNVSRAFASGAIVANREAVYYSNVSPATTAALAGKVVYPTVPAGWKSAVVSDPNGTRFFAAANFSAPNNSTGVADTKVSLSFPEGAPIFAKGTLVHGNDAEVTIGVARGSGILNTISWYVSTSGGSLTASPSADGGARIDIVGTEKVMARVRTWYNGRLLEDSTMMDAENTKRDLTVKDGSIAFNGNISAVRPDVQALGRSAHITLSIAGLGKRIVPVGDGIEAIRIKTMLGKCLKEIRIGHGTGETLEISSQESGRLNPGIYLVQVVYAKSSLTLTMPYIGQ